MADKKALPATGSTELVKASTMALAEQRPDFIETGDHSGTEHLTRDDIQMPRMGLAQQMSPELDPGNPNYIEDLKIGMLFNTLTKQLYGVGPVSFVVVRADPPRWVEFNPRESGGGVKDPNVKFDDPRTQFGPNGEHPIATKFYDFVVMLLPTRELIALSFKSTGLKVAKQLNALISLRNAPLFAGVYELMTNMTSNAKGRFAIYQIKNAGWIGDKETYAFARMACDNLKTKTLVINRDEDPDTFDVGAMEKEAAAREAERQANRSNDTDGM